MDTTVKTKPSGNGKKKVDSKAIKSALTNQKQSNVPGLQLMRVTANIVGKTPLLHSKPDLLAGRKYTGLEDGQVKKPKIKEATTEADIAEKLTWYDEEGSIAFPSSGFWKGMEAVAKDKSDIMKDVFGKQVLGAVRFAENLVKIEYEERTINISSNLPRLIIRPEFRNWSTKLHIEFVPAVLSPEEIANLLNWAGFYRGLGAWAPRSGGIYGQYQVADIVPDFV